MITNIETYSEFRRNLEENRLYTFSQVDADFYGYSKEEYDSAMYSIMDVFKKLDKKMEKAFTKKERNNLAGAIKSQRGAGRDYDKAVKESEAARQKSEGGLLNKISLVKKAREKNAEKAANKATEAGKNWSNATAGRAAAAGALRNKSEQYQKLKKGAGIAAVTVAGLAAIGYGAYKIAQKIKDSRDPKKIMDQIKELEDKGKSQGYLSKSDAEKLAALSKKLAKLAVKVDPKATNEIERDVQRAEQSIKV